MPHRGRLAVPLLLAATALAGCSGGASAPVRAAPSASAPSLRALDWADRSYPSDCFGRPGVTEDVRVHDYQATGPDGYFRMVVAHPTFGDVNGDGRTDALVTYQCIGANSSPDTLLVYLATPTGPRLAATLLGRSDEYVESLRPTGGGLVVAARGYSPGTPHCCPDLLVRTTFGWKDGRFVTLNRSSEAVAR